MFFSYDNNIAIFVYLRAAKLVIIFEGTNDVKDKNSLFAVFGCQSAVFWRIEVKNYRKCFAVQENHSIFAPAICASYIPIGFTPASVGFTTAQGPFVYRLGRKIFILERGVRLPYGLLLINEINIYVNKMANHKSSEKRIRQAKVRRLTNRYASRTTRNQVRKFRSITSREEAQKMYPEVCSMLDKLAKKKVIHQNKANNLKSKLAAHVNSLS